MKNLNFCRIGNILLCCFLVFLVYGVVYLVRGYLGIIPGHGGFLAEWKFWMLQTLLVLIVGSVIYLTGMSIAFFTSKQLGIKYRVLVLLFCFIPIINIVLVIKTIAITDAEIRFEKKKLRLNEARKKDMLCSTKYPILLVHGVFFRDFEHLNYWGRIPAELEKNGAEIYYGNHNSASGVSDSAKQLRDRIEEVLHNTGAPKVNVIAHSKGGLDTRMAIHAYNLGDKVASLTTINTPHRGCEFAEYLLDKIPATMQNSIAKAYNAGAAKLGDDNPDFIAAVRDLTHSKCEQMNREVSDDERVYYQSVGSIQEKPSSGRFPLNMSYRLVKHFDGRNDGLVGEKSFPWGSNFTLLTVKGKRGISHGDMIDLNRENIKGFDVREFYVGLVHDLKERGY